MSKSATEAKIRELARQLESEKREHARTRNEKQQELERVWRLVPGYRINLMGVYPALRKLFHVLAEAADLQDPLKGARYEDTMRTEYTPDGETLTQTERGVVAHQRDRANVRLLNRELEHIHRQIRKELEFKTHRMAQVIEGSQWEYEPPSDRCECGAWIVQPPTGRRRKKCRACSPEKVSV